MRLELIDNEVKTEPQKPVLLFVHGMAHCACFFSPTFLPWFAKKGIRACALSLTGHGKSEGGDALRWTPISTYETDLEETIQSLGQPVILIGHSMGGYVAMQYLTHHHDLKACILLTPAPSRGILRPAIRLLFHSPATALQVLMSASAKPVVGQIDRVRDILFSNRLSEKEIRPYLQYMGEESFLVFLRMFFPVIGKSRNPALPILVIGAGGDRIISETEIRRTARRFKADDKMIPDIAHEIRLDPEWEKVVQEIYDWLEKKELL